MADHKPVNGLTAYAFTFWRPGTPKPATRWIRYGKSMEETLALAMEAALREYPDAGGFLIHLA